MLYIKADPNQIADHVRSLMQIVPTAMSAMQRAPYALTGVQRVPCAHRLARASKELRIGRNQGKSSSNDRFGIERGEE